jgi:endonuclease YncB( thermonuclease family)
MLKLCSLLCLVLSTAIFSVPALAAGKRVTGTIQVIDGDTFDVGGTRVRLFGIDAPEGDQTCTDARGDELRCGSFVTTQVRDAYQGKRAMCRQIDTDRYGRSVARCTALIIPPDRAAHRANQDRPPTAVQAAELIADGSLCVRKSGRKFR